MEVAMSLLAGKRAVVFGAGGSIGGAVAREFAAQGAEVFLSGPTRDSVEAVADAIAADGGRAHAGVLDALDADAVESYLQTVAEGEAAIDIAFNAMGPRLREYRNGAPALEISAEESMLPLATVTKSQFVTAVAAGRHMAARGSGVVLLLTGSPARPHGGVTVAISAAFGAIEVLARALAIELGPAGVRVLCVRTSANADSRTVADIAEAAAMPPEQIKANLAAMTLRGVSPQTSDTAKVSAFLASEQAHMITGTVINASGGAVED
jgi:3-oxoacyl-[acyl-carrier protein] reductase